MLWITSMTDERRSAKNTASTAGTSTPSVSTRALETTRTSSTPGSASHARPAARCWADMAPLRCRAAIRWPAGDAAPFRAAANDAAFATRPWNVSTFDTWCWSTAASSAAGAVAIGSWSASVVAGRATTRTW